MMAASAASIVPVLVVYLLAQRYFIEGITLTGMKGLARDAGGPPAKKERAT